MTLMGVEEEQLREVIADPGVQQRLREIGVQEYRAAMGSMQVAADFRASGADFLLFAEEASGHADIRLGVATCIAALLDKRAALIDDIPHLDYFDSIANTGIDPISGDRFLPRW
jgi:hypothetical protein